MKRVVLVVTGVLLALVALSVGCTKTTPAPAPAPPPPATTQNATGVLTDVNTPAEPGPDVVTIQTPQGPQTFRVTPDTTIFLDGKACTIDELNKVLASGNATYNCIVVEGENCLDNLNVWRIVP